MSPRLPMRAMFSPNFGERAANARIDILLLHYTGMNSAGAACERLCDPSAEVSCHYLIDEDGAIIAMVPEDKRAWHAGAGSWEGRGDINSRSIGIEIHNPGHDGGYPPFPDRQMQAVADLCIDILQRHPIAPSRVLAHSDIAPGRKIDPGERFDWRFLHDAGIGLWVEPEPLVASPECMSLGDESPIVADLQAALAAYGYGLELTGRFDHHTQDVVSAFQRHFRQECVDGVADPSTLVTLERLLRAKAQITPSRG